MRGIINKKDKHKKVLKIEMELSILNAIKIELVLYENKNCRTQKFVFK